MRNGLAFGGLCLLAATFSHVFAQDDPKATDERLVFRVVERKVRPHVEISIGDLRLVAPEFVLAHADGSETRVQATRQGIEMRRGENALKAKTTWLALRGSPFRYSGR